MRYESLSEKCLSEFSVDMPSFQFSNLVLVEVQMVDIRHKPTQGLNKKMFNPNLHRV